MPNTNNVIKTNNRWQPRDAKLKSPTLPFENNHTKANRKKIILISVYLILLVGSLFIL